MTNLLNISKVAHKSLNGELLLREEAIQILDLPNENLPELLDAVYVIRQKHKGNIVDIQMLTNAKSGNCSQNCTYCAQARDSETDIDKYRLISYEKLLRDGTVVRDQKLARHCIGLSGIRFNDKEIDEFSTYIRNLKQETGTHICCSIGFLTLQQALKLKEAGVNRINHNLNTSRDFYPNICTTHTYEERIANIKMLQSVGFEICCGGIIGLGESKTDVVEMFFDIQQISPQAVPVNFLIPLEGTALDKADTSLLAPEYCLKTLCLARLMMPKADIRCAAGREIYLNGYEKEMFCAVDSIFASGYLTTGGQSIEETIALIVKAGFEYRLEV
jgi:biotin synthase